MMGKAGYASFLQAAASAELDTCAIAHLYIFRRFVVFSIKNLFPWLIRLKLQILSLNWTVMK